MNLDNKVALVTGGSSGLGYATANQLVSRGTRVAIFDIDSTQGLAAVAKLGKGAAHFFNVDVRDEESVEAACNEVLARFGAIHIAVNCAGVAPAKRTLDRQNQPMPLGDFKSVVDINLVGSFNVARIAASKMANNAPIGESLERGVIINTASVAGYEGQIGQTAYAASKGGIIALSLPMARDLAPLGIRVNTIAPGIMGTPMLLNMPEQLQQNLVADIQFPKRLGLPDEFASLAAHIVENAYLNGETIRLDGAIRMQPK